nr:unnamed protein product [Spirometra erinaceieuropaei]
MTGGGGGGGTIHITADQARAIDEYEEYHRIVGDDDNGRTFTPEEYEAYKRRVIPIRLKNRIYVSWVNPNGIDCILTGPETECFCGHRYRQHKTDFETIPEARPIPQPCNKCRCKCYHLMPKLGTSVVRCHCKHESTDHDILTPYLCKRPNCKCQGFKTSLTCDCGFPAYQHKDVSETAAEREARGHPIGQPCPYQAMGGITGFSSLAIGMARIDPSGAAHGTLTEEELNAPITDNDHPFLRMHKATIEEYERQKAQAGRGRGRPARGRGGGPQPGPSA